MGFMELPCETPTHEQESYAFQAAELCFIIIINPSIARVVGAPRIILQPVFSIFPWKWKTLFSRR